MSDLREQAIGAAGSICVMALGAVWIVDTPDLYRYLVTGGIFLFACCLGISKIHQNRQLKKLRERQLREHNRSN